MLETSESDSSEIITINPCQAAKHACSHTHMQCMKQNILNGSMEHAHLI
jgi:hypothetical protein